MSVLLTFMLLATPLSAFATVLPFSATPPGGGGTGGGVGEVWPWGWAVPTKQANPNAFVIGDEYEMLPTRDTRWMDAGTHTFLAWVDKNPAINKPYLVMKKNGVAVEQFSDGSAWMDHISAPVRNFGPPYPTFVSYATTTSVLPSEGTTFTAGNNCWYIPVYGVELDPGAEYQFSYLRGLRANNSVTCVTYESTSTPGLLLGYIQQNGIFTYPDELDQYNAKQWDTYEFRNPYVTYDNGQPVFEDFVFNVRTYADLTAYESALATASARVDAADLARGYLEGEYDPALVDQALADLDEATQLTTEELSTSLQADVDAATALLTGIAEYLVPFASDTTYTVTFKDWDDSVIDTQSVVYGMGAVAPQTPAREGYTFTGWDKSFAAITGDLTVTALYSLNSYTVTFRDWDGTELKSQSVDHGSAATAPADPVRELYTFTGWDADFAAVTGDLTITALYAFEGVTWETVLGVDYARVAGVSRFETAANAALEAFPAGADAVVIANGFSFADAVSAAPLAGAVDGPVLLTSVDSLHESTLAAIEALGVTTAYIAGGSGVVSDAVAEELADAGLTVERIAGLDRYETAYLLATEAVQLGADPAQVFLVRGDDFADGLAVSSIAAQADVPVLLTPTGALGAKAAEFITENDSDKVFIAGGTGAVSKTAADQAAALGVTVERWAGTSRYETCVAVVSGSMDEWGISAARVGLASGADFPDALSGGAVMGWKQGVLLLTAPSALSTPVQEFLESNSSSIDSVQFFGGTGALGAGVEAGVRAAVGSI